MAIVPFPPGAEIKRIQWTLDRPAQVNRSGWTGARQVVTQPGSALWRASFELRPLIGQAAVLRWRAFLASLKGPINTFRLPAVEASQVSVAGYAQGDQNVLTVIRLGGFPADGQPHVRAGHMLTVFDQLVIATQDAAPIVGAGDLRVVAFEPPLRRSLVLHATPVEVSRPTALVSMTAEPTGWSVDPGQIYGISGTVEEAFAP